MMGLLSGMCRRCAGPKKHQPDQRPEGLPGHQRSSFGFTKKNELFVGRVAMLGFAAELIGELAQGGKGPLGQLGAHVRRLLIAAHAPRSSCFRTPFVAANVQPCWILRWCSPRLPPCIIITCCVPGTISIWWPAGSLNYADVQTEAHCQIFTCRRVSDAHVPGVRCFRSGWLGSYFSNAITSLPLNHRVVDQPYYQFIPSPQMLCHNFAPHQSAHSEFM